MTVTSENEKYVGDENIILLLIKTMCMSTTLDGMVTRKTDNITVYQKFMEDTFAAPTIGIYVESSYDIPAVVHLDTLLPTEVETAHIKFHPDYEPTQWSQDEFLSMAVEVGQDEGTRVVFSFERLSEEFAEILMENLTIADVVLSYSPLVDELPSDMQSSDFIWEY